MLPVMGLFSRLFGKAVEAEPVEPVVSRVPASKYAEPRWHRSDNVVETPAWNRPVLMQTTRANSKPTLEPFVDDIQVPDGALDLRSVTSRRVRVVGTSNYVAGQFEVWTWVLRREPRNRHDKNAIAVHFLDGTKAGFVSAKQASTLAPLLDQTGFDRFVVTGVGSEGTTSSRLWADIPSLPALRSYVASML